MAETVWGALTQVGGTMETGGGSPTRRGGGGEKVVTRKNLGNG
jgi:hypothetical protein